MRPTLYSVGHGTRTIETFLEVLGRRPLRRLVDVRRVPASRRHPWFRREALAGAVGSAGVEYVWWGEALGGFRPPDPGSRHVALRNDLLRGYADHMDSAAFRDALETLLAAGVDGPTAFMCSESDWRRCHRRLISDAVLAAGGRVVHLLDGDDEDHRLHPAARIQDGRPVYDGGAQATLDAAG